MSWLEPVKGLQPPLVGGAGLDGHFVRDTIYVAVDPGSDQIVRHTAAGSSWVHAYSAYELLPGARSGTGEVWHRSMAGLAAECREPARS